MTRDEVIRRLRMHADAEELGNYPTEHLRAAADMLAATPDVEQARRQERARLRLLLRHRLTDGYAPTGTKNIAQIERAIEAACSDPDVKGETK